MNDYTKNEALEVALPTAAHGDRSAIVEMLHAFLSGPLYVPRRIQAHPMSDAPEYPDELLDILGVRDGERAIAPVFSRPGLIEEWCGVPLELRKMTGELLVRTLPSTWWVCINPGSEIQKELSPWEIEELHHGAEGIETIATEIVESAEPAQPLVMVPLGPGEHESLCVALRKFGADTPWITSLTIAAVPADHRIEFGDAPLVLSVVTRDRASEQQRAELGACVRLASMGEVPPRILWSDDSSAIAPGDLSASIPPLFKREENRSFLRRLLGISKG